MSGPSWRVLRPYLEPHFTVHAMDRRGRGTSGDHPDYDLARELGDVAAVADAVTSPAGSPVAVYGNSLGASAAVGAATLTGQHPPARAVRAARRPAGQAQTTGPAGAAGRPAGSRHRDGILVAAYRAVGLSDAQIDELRAQPEWPNRLAAAHTVAREAAIPPERLSDPQQAAHVAVPALVLVGSDTPQPLKASAEIVAAALPDAA